MHLKVLGRKVEVEHCHVDKILTIDNTNAYLYRVLPSNTSVWSHARVRAFSDKDRNVSLHRSFAKGRYDTVIGTEKITTRRRGQAGHDSVRRGRLDKQRHSATNDKEPGDEMSTVPPMMLPVKRHRSSSNDPTEIDER